jgi:hypothetical protein
MSATDVIGFERLEALLRGDAPRTAAEATRSELLGELRGAALRAPEELRARVLSATPARRRLAARRPSLRLALVALPAALAVAVVAALVHGFAGSGGGVSEQGASTGSGSALRENPPVARSLEKHSAGGWTSAAPVPAAAGARPRAATAPSLGGRGRLQHTDASLVVRVPDVDRLSVTTTAATRVAASLGGYAQSVVYRTPVGGGGESFLELRVPAQNVQRALARLAGLGTLVSQQVSVEDLQHALAAESAQIGQLRRTVAALQRALRDPALPDAQRVLLRIRLAESKRTLSQQLDARNGTVAAGTTARVSLVLETKESVVPVPHRRGRLGRMLHSAAGFLGLEATIVLFALIVAGPLALAAALAWGLARARRRRDERRLLAA